MKQLFQINQNIFYAVLLFCLKCCWSETKQPQVYIKINLYMCTLTSVFSPINSMQCTIPLVPAPPLRDTSCFPLLLKLKSNLFQPVTASESNHLMFSMRQMHSRSTGSSIRKTKCPTGLKIDPFLFCYTIFPYFHQLVHLCFSKRVTWVENLEYMQSINWND